ncbi:unnamed protein product [Brassica oleracea]|uniref:Uncharacterized protein n=2 Tax=Brassica oleracea TaxID=3712 RepID=A0A0D3AMN0_BRAOL|nr:unnamed protein product [Brassica oleracea]
MNPPTSHRQAEKRQTIEPPQKSEETTSLPKEHDTREHQDDHHHHPDLAKENTLINSSKGKMTESLSTSKQRAYS